MYGVYQAYYQSALLSSESESNISWIGSMQGFLLFLFSMVAGPLHDAGYLRSLLLVDTCLVVLGMMITSICTVYWQFFLAQGVAIGIGDGLLFLPSMVIISQYFSAKKAFAIGIASMGSSIGNQSLLLTSKMILLLTVSQEPSFIQQSSVSWNPALGLHGPLV